MSKLNYWPLILHSIFLLACIFWQKPWQIITNKTNQCSEQKVNTTIKTCNKLLKHHLKWQRLPKILSLVNQSPCPEILTSLSITLNKNQQLTLNWQYNEDT